MRRERCASLWRIATLAALLVLAVQGLSLVPLLSHWACADHCEAEADCHPAAGDAEESCDPSCACVGCPAHQALWALPSEPVLFVHPLPGTPMPLDILARPAQGSLQSLFRPPVA